MKIFFIEDPTKALYELNQMTVKSKRLFLAWFFFTVSFAASILSFAPNVSSKALIGHADEADVAEMAKNFLNGAGFSVSNTWLYTAGGLPGTQVIHPEIYWSPYLAGIEALSFYFLGPNRAGLVFPALLTKLFIVTIVTYLIWSQTRQFLLTATAILAVTFSSILLYSINGLSDIYLAATVIGFVFLLSKATVRKNISYFVSAGIFLGIGAGIKPSALLLLGTWPVLFFFNSNMKSFTVRIISLSIGLVAGLAPYIYYNLSSFGSIFAPGIPLVLKSQYIDFHLQNIGFLPADAHNQASYNPARDITITFTDRIALALHNYRDFIKSGVIGGEVVIGYLAILIFISILGIFISKHADQKEWGFYRVFEIFSLCILALSLVLPFVVHYEARYWCFTVPIQLYFALMALRYLPHAAKVFVVLVSLYQGAVAYHGIQTRLRSDAYAMVTKLIPKGSRIFTANPWEFAFHTGIPALMTPYNNDISTLKTLARRYSANYLVVIDGDSRHEYYKKLHTGQPLDGLSYLYRDNKLIIATIDGVDTGAGSLNQPSDLSPNLETDSLPLKESVPKKQDDSKTDTPDQRPPASSPPADTAVPKPGANSAAPAKEPGAAAGVPAMSAPIVAPKATPLDPISPGLGP